MNIRTAVLFLIAMAAAAHAWASPPELPDRDYEIVGAFAFGDDDAAREAWVPMEGSPPVSVAAAGDRPVLRMRCNLAGTRHERASWDWPVALDLSRARGVRFRFHCPDPMPVSSLTFYFRSGEGWYPTKVSPFSDTTGGWSTVTVDKSTTSVEDKPSGWGAVDAIRISAWRGADLDTEFYIADFGIVESDTGIAIVRAEAAAAGSPSKAHTVREAALRVAGYLNDLGIPGAVLSDLELDAGHLAGIDVAILPYNPDMPDDTVRTLASFVKNGGKIVSFYILPPGLQRVVGIEEGEFVQPDRPDRFATIRSREPGLRGLPRVIGQRSWNIRRAKPLDERGFVVADWYDADGRPTEDAAIVATDAGVHMTHILLRDDADAKRMLLLAMIGHLAPEYFVRAAGRIVEEAGAVGPYASVDEMVNVLRREEGHKDDVLALADDAARHRDVARERFSQGEYAEAMASARDANRAALETYCAMQKPAPGEFRAFWCHNAFGVPGMTWDEAAGHLAAHGFTAVIPNMLWGNIAFYESGVLPVAPEVAEQGDQIALCSAACKKHGLECHIWKVNWRFRGKASDAFCERMGREDRLQVRRDGSEDHPWLCPSHPANQELEIDSMVEIAEKYDVDGIHFDYIRYPDGDACFCDGCRERFEGTLGRTVADWPEDVFADEAVEAAWLEFRRVNITRVVSEVSRRAREAKPGIRISAAVFPNWLIHRDRIAQDWKRWCEQGYLDFVCPMDYTPHAAEFENMVRRQIEWAGNVPCYPGIGVSTWPASRDIPLLIQQIHALRRLGAPGFTVFNYGPTEAQGVLPLLGMGVTRPVTGAPDVESSAPSPR